jgi:endonuclease/exonuclease/phosphatase family metal-dependent hydrolase
MQGRLSVLIALVLGGLVLLAGSCRRDASAHAAAGPSTLRIVSWNVHACEGGIDAIIAELRRLNADIVCLQEVSQGSGTAEEPDQVRHIADALGMDVFHCSSSMPDETHQCVVILGRVPFTSTSTLELGPHRHYGVTGVTTWQGEPLRIVGVHLAATYLLEWQHILQTCRERTREAVDLVARVDAWSGPIVLLGDLNTTPGSGVYNRLSGALIPVVFPAATFPAHHPVLQLDHVLLSRGGCRRRARKSPSRWRPTIDRLWLMLRQCGCRYSRLTARGTSP